MMIRRRGKGRRCGRLTIHAEGGGVVVEAFRAKKRTDSRAPFSVLCLSLRNTTLNPHDLALDSQPDPPCGSLLTWAGPALPQPPTRRLTSFLVPTALPTDAPSTTDHTHGASPSRPAAALSLLRSLVVPSAARVYAERMRAHTATRTGTAQSRTHVCRGRSAAGVGGGGGRRAARMCRSSLCMCGWDVWLQGPGVCRMRRVCGECRSSCPEGVSL